MGGRTPSPRQGTGRRACQEEAARRTQLPNEQNARARQVARRQQLVNEEAARICREEAAACACQEEAARQQQLLDELAACACQEAAACACQEEASRRQKLINEAAQTIFLWLCRHRLHVRLTRQTARRQHREAALARLRYEDPCHRRAKAKRREDARAKEEHHLDEAKHRADALHSTKAILAEVAARIKAEFAKLAKAANEQRWHEAATRAEKSTALTLVKERHCHKAGLAAEAVERRRHETVLAAEANERRRHEAVLAAEVDKCRRHEAVLAAEADNRHCHEAVLVAEAANEQRWQESAARAAESNMVIERIRTEFALCAAPLDAILAEIACEEAAFKTKLSPHRPTSYVDAVLSTMGGGHTTIFAPRCLAFSSCASSSTIA